MQQKWRDTMKFERSRSGGGATAPADARVALMGDRSSGRRTLAPAPWKARGRTACVDAGPGVQACHWPGFAGVHRSGRRLTGGARR
jgi:hypothetical protein